jgi:hypothetical protein
MVMSNRSIITECELADGVMAIVSDDSRHYFGGYYHVRLRINAEIQLRRDWFATEAEFEDAGRRLGEGLLFTRTLEKMAVPADEIEVVRSSLLESFESNVLTYMSRPDFPSRFALSEYGKAIKSVVARVYAPA